jgi:hypothetical protein
MVPPNGSGAVWYYSCMCMWVAYKVCLEALSKALPYSIAEVNYDYNLTAEVNCPRVIPQFIHPDQVVEAHRTIHTVAPVPRYL